MRYKVSFVKDLLNSQGKTFECVQEVLVVDASSPDEAVSVAKQEFEQQHGMGYWQLHADKVEVIPSRPDDPSSERGRRRHNGKRHQQGC